MTLPVLSPVLSVITPVSWPASVGPHPAASSVARQPSSHHQQEAGAQAGDCAGGIGCEGLAEVGGPACAKRQGRRFRRQRCHACPRCRAGLVGAPGKQCELFVRSRRDNRPQALGRRSGPKPGGPYAPGRGERMRRFRSGGWSPATVWCGSNSRARRDGEAAMRRRGVPRGATRS